MVVDEEEEERERRSEYLRDDEGRESKKPSAWLGPPYYPKWQIIDTTT